MADICLDGANLALHEGESVLDCLLRHGRALSHSCRAGVCQSCLVQGLDTKPPPAATASLKATLQAEGFALACQWRPSSDIAIRLPGAAAAALPAHIAGLDALNAGVLRLRLELPGDSAGFSCHPGQYCTLVNPAGVARSYSVANDPAREGCLEFHIAATPRGLFTGWLFTEAGVGQCLHVRGPAGACFYVPDTQQDFPLLLAGTGTGLAPLYGIARDALRQGHKGPITLLHGAARSDRLYYVEELRALAREHANFSYLPVVRELEQDTELQQGDLALAALTALDAGRVAEQRVFLCGGPDFVQALRKQVFLKGVRSGHIFCDAFISLAVSTGKAVDTR